MGGSEEEEKPDVSFLGLHHRVRDTCVTSTCTASVLVFIFEFLSFLKQNIFILLFSKGCLLQHVNRSIYQAGIWTTSVDSQQIVPSPEEFSWKKEDGAWVPKWISIPEVSKACRELIRCTCKGVCKRCKCSKASLECTPLCNCKCVNTVDNS